MLLKIKIIALICTLVCTQASHGLNSGKAFAKMSSTIAAGGESSYVVMTDGSLWAWGSNWAGTIGDGTITDRHCPTKVLENVISISAVQ